MNAWLSGWGEHEDIVRNDENQRSSDDFFSEDATNVSNFLFVFLSKNYETTREDVSRTKA